MKHLKLFEELGALTKSFSTHYIKKVTPEEMIQIIGNLSGTESLVRYSNYPGIGIDSSKQLSNNWASAIFFNTLRYTRGGWRPRDGYKYIILATLKSSKILDSKNYSISEWLKISRDMMDLGGKISREDSLSLGEGIRQAHLRSGFDVLIGGHGPSEVTVFDESAVSIDGIYEIVKSK